MKANSFYLADAAKGADIRTSLRVKQQGLNDDTSRAGSILEIGPDFSSQPISAYMIDCELSNSKDSGKDTNEG